MRKQKTCKICKDKFIPERDFQTTCNINCAIEYAKQLRDKREATKKKNASKSLREFKNSSKVDLKREIQPLANK